MISTLENGFFKGYAILTHDKTDSNYFEYYNKYKDLDLRKDKFYLGNLDYFVFIDFSLRILYVMTSDESIIAKVKYFYERMESEFKHLYRESTLIETGTPLDEFGDIINLDFYGKNITYYF